MYSEIYNKKSNICKFGSLLSHLRPIWIVEQQRVTMGMLIEWVWRIMIVLIRLDTLPGSVKCSLSSFNSRNCRLSPSFSRSFMPFNQIDLLKQTTASVLRCFSSRSSQMFVLMQFYWHRIGWQSQNQTENAVKVSRQSHAFFVHKTVFESCLKDIHQMWLASGLYVCKVFSSLASNAIVTSCEAVFSLSALYVSSDLSRFAVRWKQLSDGFEQFAY